MGELCPLRRKMFGSSLRRRSSPTRWGGSTRVKNECEALLARGRPRLPVESKRERVTRCSSGTPSSALGRTRSGVPGLPGHLRVKRCRRTPSHNLKLPGKVIVKREDFLLTSVVKRPTLEKYATAVGAFREFCRTHALQLDTMKQKDRALKLFFVALYDDGFSASVGRYTFFAVMLLMLKITTKDVLSQSMCTLKGWQARCPGRMRLPIPEELAYQVAVFLLRKGDRESATAMVMQLDAYLRPTEAAALAMRNTLPPAPSAGLAHARCWGLVIAPQASIRERGRGAATTRCCWATLAGR